MEFNIRKIGLGDLEALSLFVQNLGESSKTFRYFESRPLTIIENHLLTVLASNNEGEEIGYGHLDLEDGVTWLGVAVSDKHVGKGLGTAIMNFLIDYADNNGVDELKLAVDKINKSAIKLYNRTGFKVSKELEKSILMVRNGQ
ncbi:GNAT family N-acetyltransferase [Algoriphagus namhaensis]|uniref:GNAT family N-acetyltransferase n=1 Tax=Algoriphagus namhaensis TaxID=915353 RepID=A0ABV8AS91_9BACT